MYSAQRAKTRARQRARHEEPLELTAGYVVPDLGDEAPFAPPPLDDIFGLEDGDEETAVVSDEALFDPPTSDDFLADTGEDETCFVDEAPFDPPEFDAEPTFSPPQAVREPAPQPAKPAPIPAQRERPLPAISVYASWDRPETEALVRQLAADPRLARADMQIARGGLDGAVSRAHAGDVDLFLLDTTLDGSAMLAALDRLRAAAPRACVVILGAVNDISLLRELAARGVSDYIVLPAQAGDVARSLCALFADVEPARTIAVIGARGGLGASTLARNIAWSIAERQQKRTTLVDLDLSFGSAAPTFRLQTSASVLDVVEAEDGEAALMQALANPTRFLQLLTAPATTAELEMEQAAFEALASNVRRTASFVVLDLPHAWEPWIRSALRDADEVVIVAGPDLASLRNADNMLKLLRSERDKTNAPHVVITMSGLPKRPEIPTKDFAEAIHVKPTMTFAFEPELFGAAEADGQMIHEAAPDSKAALQLDLLASLLTGHEPKTQVAPHVVRENLPPERNAEPVLELVTLAPIARRKRGVARTGFVALYQPQPRQKQRSTGLVRKIAAVAALVAVGVWYAGQRDLSDIAAAHVVNAFRA